MKLAMLVVGIAVAIGSSAAAQDASVQSSTRADSRTQIAEGGELNATLTRPIDAGRAKPGDEVTATLSQSYESNGQVVLRSGTELVGRVTEAQPRQRRSVDAGGSADSRLAVVFEKAVLEDGREVPLVATVQAVAAAEAAASGGARGLHGAALGSPAGAGRAGGELGGVAGTVGGTLGGVGGAGSGLGTVAGSTVGHTTRASAGAAGGVNAAGRLMSGSRGAFGMSGIDVASAAAGGANGSVLTSHTRDVELERGTQLLLVTRAAGNAQGSAGATRGAE